MLEQPAKGGTEIVAFCIEPLEPENLIRQEDFRFGLLRERNEVVRVSLSEELSFPAPFQPVERVLPDCFEHEKAGLARRPFVLAEETLLDERSDAVEGGRAELSLGVAHGLCSLDRTAAHENREAGEEPLLARAEKAVAPVDRVAKGPLTGRGIARAPSQQHEPLAESPEESLRTQYSHPGSAELDRKRKAIEPGTDLGDGPDVLARQLEPGLHRLRPLDEELHRLARRERRRRHRRV